MDNLKYRYSKLLQQLKGSRGQRNWARHQIPLYERIWRVEQERDHLSNVLELDEQTVASQRKLLDKYDADNTKLLQENTKLKAQVNMLSASVTNVEEKSALATFDNALRNHCDRKQQADLAELRRGRRE